MAYLIALAKADLKLARQVRALRIVNTTLGTLEVTFDNGFYMISDTDRKQAHYVGRAAGAVKFLVKHYKES